jgi:tRNA threonylcarbamoyladenosine biosynthesis protein TsaB
MTPVLLAFDTSTERLSVALLVSNRPDGGGSRPGSEAPPTQDPAAWATLLADGQGGPLASVELLPTAAQLLQKAGLRWADLTGIGFGQGPGAFTGLRTACSVAQGLAFGCGIAVWPLDTLAAVLEEATVEISTSIPDGDWGWSVQDARMGEVYAAAYRRQHGRWRRVAGPWLAAPADLAVLAQAATGAPVPVPAVVAGSALADPRLADALSLARGAQHLRPAAWPSARAIASVMRQTWTAGPGVAAADAQPLYLRDKVAQTLSERRDSAARAGAVGVSAERTP